MTISRAIQILDLFQQWQKGKMKEMPMTPEQLTYAITTIVDDYHRDRHDEMIRFAKEYAVVANKIWKPETTAEDFYYNTFKK